MGWVSPPPGPPSRYDAPMTRRRRDRDDSSPWKVVHDKPVQRSFNQCAHCGDWAFDMDWMEVRYQRGLTPGLLMPLVFLAFVLPRLGRGLRFMGKHFGCAVIWLERN